MAFELTPENVQLWVGIGQAIVSGGEALVNDFKGFLADHGIEADNAILDAQIIDDDAKIAEEQKIKDS